MPNLNLFITAKDQQTIAFALVSHIEQNLSSPPTADDLQLKTQYESIIQNLMARQPLSDQEIREVYLSLFIVKSVINGDLAPKSFSFKRRMASHSKDISLDRKSVV